MQQLFPHIPTSIVLDDLRVTRSVELTVENILDGRLVAPAIFREPEPLQQSSSSPLLNTEVASSNSGINHNWDELETDNCEP